MEAEKSIFVNTVPLYGIFKQNLVKLYLEDEVADTVREYAKVKRKARKTQDPELKEKSKELLGKFQILCNKLGY